MNTNQFKNPTHHRTIHFFFSFLAEAKTHCAARQVLHAVGHPTSRESRMPKFSRKKGSAHRAAKAKPLFNNPLGGMLKKPRKRRGVDSIGTTKTHAGCSVYRLKEPRGDPLPSGGQTGRRRPRGDTSPEDGASSSRSSRAAAREQGPSEEEEVDQSAAPRGRGKSCGGGGTSSSRSSRAAAREQGPSEEEPVDESAALRGRGSGSSRSGGGARKVLSRALHLPRWRACLALAPSMLSPACLALVLSILFLLLFSFSLLHVLS